MRRFCSPALIVSVVAVVLAATGGALAAGSITGGQIKDSSLTGRDVKNRSLTLTDLSLGTRDALRGGDGVDGAQGPPGVLALTTVTGADVTLAPGSGGASPLAQCPTGFVVIGTGFSGPLGRTGGFVQAYGTLVGGFFVNDSLIPVPAHVQAICAQIPTGSGLRSAAVGSGLDRYQADVARARAQLR